MAKREAAPSPGLFDDLAPPQPITPEAIVAEAMAIVQERLSQELVDGTSTIEGVPVGIVPSEPEEIVYPTVVCPKCSNETTDYDGFGFVACAKCGYCTHPSSSDGVCGICGQTLEMPTAAIPLVEPPPEEPALPLGPANGQGLLGGMFSEDQLNDLLSSQVFARVDEDIEVDYRCPVCFYEWSGNPKPKLADQEAELGS